MRFRTKRQIIRDVRVRWDRQYASYTDDHRLAGGVSVGDIRARLHALDLEDCTSADVAAAIGNGSWAENKCDDCGEDADVVVCFGPQDRDEGDGCDVCRRCLNAALGALKALEGQSQ